MAWKSFRPVGLGAPACAVLAFLAGPVRAQNYAVDEGRSEVRISVGRSGLFSFAGHSHEVLATGVEGEIAADATDVARSTVRLVFDAGSLSVSAKGEPEGDAPKVQEKMRGPDVLDVSRFPTIAFRSTAVEGRLVPDGSWNLRVTGELTIKGASRAIVLPMRVHVADGTLTATGSLVLKQSDFGLRPVSVAGVVKVKNELGVDYKIVGRVAP